MVLASATVSGLLVTKGGHGVADAIRLATFQVVSVITSTGFATADFATWDERSRGLLLGLMFMGGCAGSAAGGLKIVRVLLITRYALQELRRTLHPRAVLPVKLSGRVVPEPVMRSVLVFLLYYLLTFVVCAAIVTAAEDDISIGVTGRHRLARQRRPRVRCDRADGQLRRPDRRQQGRPDHGDVAWPPRAADRARLSRSTGVGGCAVAQPPSGWRILTAHVSDGSPSTLARRSR